MAKIKYYYDTETCKYEELKRTTSDIFINVAGFAILSLFFSFLLFHIARTYFPSPSELALKEENEQLLLKYKLLSKQMDDVSEVLQTLQERDDKMYRLIFEAEPIADEIRKGGVGGAQKYRDMLDAGLKHGDLIINSFKKLDRLKRQMYVQSKSYDEIVKMHAEKERRLASIPAIRPVADNDLTMFISGFGMRMHPIYKVRKFHSGCDFSAPAGTPVYATGDGVVRMADYDGGYGKCIEIDHGFGFATKYAHLSAYTVKVGQKVKRGQMIGRVGNTGTSVSSHLHYEVIKNGQKVNPIGYFFNDLSPEQYTKMLQIAAQDRPSLGGN